MLMRLQNERDRRTDAAWQQVTALVRAVTLNDAVGKAEASLSGRRSRHVF
jgi:hypothetical protein